MSQLNLIAILILLCTFEISIAQESKIQGKVLDTNNTPLEFALVTLHKLNDSVIIKSTYSEQDGSFLFEQINMGKYYISCTLTSFDKKQSNTIEINLPSTKIILDPFILKPNSQQLSEVTISASKPYIERKIDRTIVNVDALISNQGTNILEALGKSPGINIDENGLIRMKGRSGVAVYIDDKPIQLSGTDLQNYLQAIPTSTIQRIELMTNPPARYDAAGNAGIINIVTKKVKTKGIHGSVNLGLTQGRYSRSNNSIALNMNYNKFTIYSQISGGYRTTFQDLNINRFYKNPDLSLRSSFRQNSFIVKKADLFNTKSGIDYFLNKNTQLGASVRTQWQNLNDHTDNLAYISSSQLLSLQEIKADNRDKSKFTNQTYNLYLKQNIGSKGSNLYSDVDYVKFNTTNNQIFKNTVKLLDSNSIKLDQTLGNAPTKIDIIGSKLDYVSPISSNSKLELGAKISRTITDNLADYKIVIDKDTSPNYNLSNRFEYNERILAFYANYSRQIKNIGIQCGLRSEYTDLSGYQYGNPIIKDSSISNNYLSLFPTFYLNWNLDTSNNQVLNLSYGRRIDRPFFQDLNPFISPLDKFTFYGGNPNLKPTFTHNLSLSHTYKGSLSTSINYSISDNNIVETLEIIDTIYYSRPGNVANNQQISLSVENTSNLKKWWTLSSYVEGGYVDYKSKLYTESLHSNGYYCFLQLTNIFQLPKEWTIETRADYQSDLVYSQLLIKSWGTLNLAVAKKILKSKATIKLSINDILYTRRADGIIYNLNRTDADWNSRLDSRNVNLNVAYRFGKALRNTQRNENTGSAEEQRRVKN